MKQATLLLIALLNVLNSLAQTNNYNELIVQKANQIEQKVITWRHNIHQHPELGNREFCTAEAAGATAVVELPYESHFPVTFNNVDLTKSMLSSMQKSAGADNVLLVPAITGAEDFSFFAQKVLGLFFFLGGMSKGKDPKTAGSHHTPEFYIDDTAFKLGVISFCNLVFDYAAMNKK